MYTYPVLACPPKAVLGDEQTLREKDDSVSAIAPAIPRYSDPDMSCSTLKELDISTTELTARQDSTISITDIKKEAHLTFSQPTCPICLDDFVPGSSVVRELPCAHIFHPDCVDTFLMQNSSLCPLCKKSVLPPDFCPTRVTNLMVRRERLLRRAHRLQESARRRNARTERSNSVLGVWIRSQSVRSIRSINYYAGAPYPDEFGRMSSSVSSHSTSDEESEFSSRPSSVASSQDRRETMRMRALAMLGSRGMSEEERQREENLPRCMCFLFSVFKSHLFS